MLHNETTPTLLLVSKSPRRRRLIEWLGLPYEVAEVDVDESIKRPLPLHTSAHIAGTTSGNVVGATFMSPEENVKPTELEEVVSEIAHRKAIAARGLPEAAGRIILTFDTLVSFEGEMLGKPRDEADARATLARLSGREHQVITGMAVWFPGEEEPHVEAVTTNVFMRDLSQADIDTWIAQGEYTGCAGSYNIEAQVASVAEAECFQNVVGLPLCHLHRVLSRTLLPADCLVSPHETCDDTLGRRCGLSID